MAGGPLIVGNWKMFCAPSQARELAVGVCAALDERLARTVVLCPPHVSLTAVSEAIKGTGVRLGAQNLHWEDEGAYTGEISAPMLCDAGCDFVIVGHSERRQLFGETNDTVSKKARAALAHGLRPIICVGETEAERDEGHTERVVVGQLLSAVQGLTPDQVAQLVVAYEPVWAIGTGRAATPAQAQEVHARLKGALADLYERGRDVPVLYGGSVKPDNARAVFEQPDIDGALVGGASLDAASFIRIAASWA